MQLMSLELIQQKILIIRGKKVMIDYDLAQIYGVKTFRLNEAVKRNRRRFPQDFMFQLTTEEKEELIANCDQFKTLKHSTQLPFVFTEQGVAMLSTVLKSDRAIEVNILIMRAFVRLRELLQTHKDLWEKIEEMESNYDHQFKVVFDAIKQIMNVEEKPKRRMGFHAD